MGIINKEKLDDLVSNLAELKLLEFEKEEFEQKLLEAQDSMNEIKRKIDFVQELIDGKESFIKKVYQYEVKK